MVIYAFLTYAVELWMLCGNHKHIVKPQKENIMRICIHRGSKQIGGSCVEVQSSDKRLLIDFGLPLDAESEDLMVVTHPCWAFSFLIRILIIMAYWHTFHRKFRSAWELPLAVYLQQPLLSL